MRKIEIPEKYKDIFIKKQEELKTEKKNLSNILSKEDMYKILDVSENDNIDINDYLEFVRNFGKNIDAYKKYLPIKEYIEIEWKEFKGITFGKLEELISLKQNRV